MNISMIYFSSTGNTEKMAEALKVGFEKAGNVVNLFEGGVAAEDFMKGDVLVIGTPACGTEEYDETIIKPLIDEIEDFQNKKLVLFGSYGWGDGEYMENLKDELEDMNVDIIKDFVMLETPDESMIDELKAFGESLK